MGGNRGLFVAVTTCALLAASVTASVAASAAEPGCEQMTYVAHRGVTAGGVTENTLGAMRQAAARGAGSEIDLRTTADGRIVLMHDATLARTTTGTGRVAQKTSAQLKKVRADDGQAVPFARAALKLVRDTPGTSVVLDLKALTPQGQATIAATIVELEIADRVSAISFHDDLVAGFRAANPGLSTFRILEQLPTPDRAATFGGVNVWAHRVSEEWVASMAAAGVPFNVRVTQDEAAWDLAVRVRSSWVMTDDVEAWLAYCPGAAAGAGNRDAARTLPAASGHR